MKRMTVAMIELDEEGRRFIEPWLPSISSSPFTFLHSTLGLPLYLSTSVYTSLYLCHQLFALWVCTPVRLQYVHSAQCTVYSAQCIPVLHCTPVRCIEITECLQTLHNAFHCMPALKCIAAQCSDQSWYEQGGGGFPYFLTSATLPLCPFATLLTSPEEIHLSYSKKYIWHILRNTLYIFTESTKYSLEK